MSNSDIPWHQNAGFYSNPNTELTVVYNTDELVKQHSVGSALHAGKIFSSVHLHEADRRMFPSHSSSKASLWLWSSFLCSFLVFLNSSLLFSNSKDTNRKKRVYICSNRMFADLPPVSHVCKQPSHDTPTEAKTHIFIQSTTPEKQRTFDQLDGVLIKPRMAGTI